MAKRKIFIILIISFVAQFASGQNDYYIGLDIGPKFDYYRLATGGTRPYHPSIKIYNQMAATFGVVGWSFIVEERYQVEVGIYKSDYRVTLIY